jgi:hypothetical protein
MINTRNNTAQQKIAQKAIFFRNNYAIELGVKG